MAILKDIIRIFIDGELPYISSRGEDRRQDTAKEDLSHTCPYEIELLHEPDGRIRRIYHSSP